MVEGKDNVLKEKREERRTVKNKIHTINQSDAQLGSWTTAVPTRQAIGSNEDPNENPTGEIYGKEDNRRNRGSCGENSHFRVSCSPLPQACVLLSSDSEVEFCRCVEQSEQCAQNVTQMKSSDDISCSDSDFLGDHLDSDSDSSGSTSSSEYLQPEEESDTETEEERKVRRISDRRKKNTKRRTTGPGRRQRAVKKQAVIMDASEDHELMPRSGFSKDKGEGKSRRCTRGSQKLSKKKQSEEVERGESSRLKPMGSKKVSKKQSGSVRTQKGSRKASPTVVEAIFGNLQNCVADAQELRRKMNEDAVKCGRMTRTVGDGAKTFPVQQKIGSHSDKGVPEQDENRDPTHEFASCNQSIRTNQVSSDFRSTPCRAGDEGIEQVGDELQDHLVSDRSIHEGLQASELNLQSQFPTAKATYRTGAEDIVDESKRKEKTVAIEDHHARQRNCLTGKSGSSSAPAYRDSRHYASSHSREARSPPEGRRLQQQWSYDSQSGSRWGQPPTAGEGFRSSSGRRSRSSSPARRQGVQLTREDRLQLQLEKSNNPLSPEETVALSPKTFEEVDDRDRRRSKDLASTFNCYQYRRSVSPCGSLEREKGRTSIGMKTSPSTSFLRGPSQFTEANYNAPGFQMKEDVQILSLSDDRKRRRHKQSIRECQKIQRQSEGKKPFHLTVTSEGIPYGPGRPAWIGQINKLAKWLDPSCTDIRRQAHGDICIFKDRLNENFEYSGDLNEDYLRGLMGKAVTRRRTEIISLINMGGSCPPQMDVKIWKRLELLAASKQREMKSEHGRFANSCRRTLGRTGASGEEGIRERLREMFGRSPDPDEVADEMERDKGYGKLKEGTSLQRSQRRHEPPHEVIDEGNRREQSRGIQLRVRHSYDEDFRMQELSQNVSNQALKNKQAPVGSHCEQTDWIPEGRQLICGSEGQDVTRKYTKDEHIARLEAELESLKGYHGKSSSRSQEKSRIGWSPEKY